jgi:SNF2 family DNA or RNA helicase
VWDNELFDTLVPRGKTVAVLHGSRARRAQLLAEAHDYYIINHDGIKILEQELIDKEEIDLIILDEFAQFRNAKTAKYKALAKVAAISTGRKLWQLSGTPAPTAPTDVWSLAKLSNPNNVPKYFTRFRDLLMKQVNQFKWVPKNGWEVVATAAIQPSIRFEREHCIDIPATMYETRTAEMSKEQTKAYKKMVEEYVIQAREGLITAANEGVKLQKLMQIATGAVYTVDRTVVEYDVSPKFKVLMDLIEEAGNKAIVFTPFKHSIKLLAEALKRKNLSVGVVNGDVSPRKRSEIFTAFQKYELDLLLAHPKTMSHGLTLTASNVIIWWGPTDFETYDQACGRITRSGQKGTPLIVQITCSPVEERAYKRLRNKESTQGLLLELLTS